MLDVDGTLIKYDYGALPSDKVVKAIKAAQKKIAVSIVTGRSFGSLTEILEKLNLKTGFAVINNGATVLDIATKRFIYDQPIGQDDAQEIAEILFEDKMAFYLKQDIMHRYVDQKEPFQKGEEIKCAYMFYSPEIFSSDQIDNFFKKLSHLNELTLYKTHHKDPDKFGFHISHVKATKLHGIEAIMKELGVKSDEIIGVGDGYNDFPLLMACGLKVAMGNAIEDLKELADYVAPTVDENGVADVINKFVLA